MRLDRNQGMLCAAPALLIRGDLVMPLRFSFVRGALRQPLYTSLVVAGLGVTAVTIAGIATPQVDHGAAVHPPAGAASAAGAEPARAQSVADTPKAAAPARTVRVIELISDAAAPTTSALADNDEVTPPAEADTDDDEASPPRIAAVPARRNAPTPRAFAKSASPPIPRSMPSGDAMSIGAVFPAVTASAAPHAAATASDSSTPSAAPSTRASGAITTASIGAPLAAVLAPAVIASHPRLILDGATLATLRLRAAANTAQWRTLKATCDRFLGGSVNNPSGDTYPNSPSLGSGYQGSEYLPALLAEGMCYQVLKTTNPTLAAQYGAKAVDILMKMATPAGSGGVNPCTDTGYGIRFYGVGYGLGFDWLYDLLSTAQRSQVITTANSWLTAWEAPNGCAAFEYAHPQSNYYAGYFHAKAVIALGTYGDNNAAPAQWTDWYTNQFAKRVQPYYARHLAGGGWPEGYANYAPLGILNMSLPAREVKTATGVDLVNATAAYRYPVDSAAYLMHFTWPSRDYIDDRDTNRSNGGGTQPGTADVGLFQQVLADLRYWNSPLAPALTQYTSDVAAATSGGGTDPWLALLAVDANAPTVALASALPLSYLASGLGAVSARSDWGKSAAWMSFRAGPYVNNPGQGEEYFDQGSLALVRGKSPLLLNASGWLVHNPGGTAEEDRIYSDNYGSFDGSVFKGNRQLYNVFYARNISGARVAAAYGQGAYTTEDDAVRTQVTAFEDGGDYVYTLATHLEDMYRPAGGSLGQGVTGWSRQITYLRPGRFVVYDRTTTSNTALDQFMAWHFPASPTRSSTATGANRFDVTYAGGYAGAMTTVLPVNAPTATAGLYPGSNPTKAWQVQVRPSNGNTSQQWLTVFDLATSATGVAAATPVTVNQGNVLGVRLAASDGVSVVINSAGAAGTPIAGAFTYFVPAEAARHVITELKPGTGYSVTVGNQAGGRTVTINPGGTLTSSAGGVLEVTVNATGTVGVPAPPAPPAPPPPTPPPTSPTAPPYSPPPVTTIPVAAPIPVKPGS